MPMPVWYSPPSQLALTATDLHVWRAALDQPAALIRHLHDTLSADERARAARFHFDRDCRRFVIAHGALRSIIGAYLNTSPRQVAFAYGVKGKPALSLSPGGDQLHFNLSHSHELAVYAFARHPRVGVDVEYTRRAVSDADQLAARFFSAYENTVYGALPAGEKQAAFFRCWTRKEAYIKAIGDGLSQPLDRFDVTLALDQPVAILNIDGDQALARQWSLFHLEPESGYVGAIAIERHDWQLAYWSWNSLA